MAHKSIVKALKILALRHFYIKCYASFWETWELNKPSLDNPYLIPDSFKNKI